MCALGTNHTVLLDEEGLMYAPAHELHPHTSYTCNSCTCPVAQLHMSYS